jgi:hypothetical protein
MEVVERQISKALSTGKVDRAALEYAHQKFRRTILMSRKVNAGKGRPPSPPPEFSITFRSSGEVELLTGWDALAARLGVGVGTARSMMSAGKGERHTLLVSKTTGEGDSATITRTDYVPGAGRPRKIILE